MFLFPSISKVTPKKHGDSQVRRLGRLGEAGPPHDVLADSGLAPRFSQFLVIHLLQNGYL